MHFVGTVQYAVMTNKKHEQWVGANIYHWYTFVYALFETTASALDSASGPALSSIKTLARTQSTRNCQNNRRPS